MPRPTLIERAQKYVAAMPAGISGQGRHAATVEVANVLLNGFGLDEGDAWAILCEYNDRCQPPSPERKLEYRFALAKRFDNANKETHWLREGKEDYGQKLQGAPARAKAYQPPPKPVYDPELLQRTAEKLGEKVDLIYLANRSVLDPALVTTEGFLERVLRPGERALVFNLVNREGDCYSQGEALWPDEALPRTGRCGVWWLIQPVDGRYHPNPRTGSKSRRSEESVTRWPYMILESDDAPVLQWMAVLVQLPIKIVAIYSSGGRSVHALVRIDATTKLHWDALVKGDELMQQDSLALGMRVLILNGADRGVFSAVRLSRLPGCFREGKIKDGKYERFKRPALQKLLYLNPEPEARPICTMLPRRDVVGQWCAAAAAGIADADETHGQWLFDALRFYAPVSSEIRDAAKRLREGMKV